MSGEKGQLNRIVKLDNIKTMGNLTQNLIYNIQCDAAILSIKHSF